MSLNENGMRTAVKPNAMIRWICLARSPLEVSLCLNKLSSGISRALSGFGIGNDGVALSDWMVAAPDEVSGGADANSGTGGEAVRGRSPLTGAGGNSPRTSPTTAGSGSGVAL